MKDEIRYPMCAQVEGELDPGVWTYEGPTADGSSRFEVGDEVEMLGVGGPFPVTCVDWDGEWVYALPPSLDRAHVARHPLRVQLYDGRWMGRTFYPQTHLRFYRRSS